MRFPIRLPWTSRDRATRFERLGKLERALLERLWTYGESSVREVHQHHQPALAYTTVMTTLDRLYKKGLLHRRKEGRAFFYSPVMSRTEYRQSVTRELVRMVLENAEPAPAGVFSCFVDAVTEKDARLLKDLESMVKQKRRETEGTQ
jgi:predicted transcriptional regulator